jgi:hypothetical protein
MRLRVELHDPEVLTVIDHVHTQAQTTVQQLRARQAQQPGDRLRTS